MTNEIRIPYSGETDCLENLNTVVRRRIGDMCFVSGIPDERTDAIRVGIYSDEIISDSVSDDIRVRFVRRDNVFQGYFEEGDFGKILVFPDRDYIKKNIEKQKIRSIERSEGAVLESAGSMILRIPQVKNQMNPIYEIVSNLLYSGSVKRDHFNWKMEKMDRYLDFLSDLDIVRVCKDEISPGPVMERNMDSDMDYDNIYERMIGKVVEKNMVQMMYSLNMTHIQPFIRMSNANCMISRSEESALKWNPSKYLFYINRLYPGKKKGEISKIISNAATLSQVGIFSKERMDDRDTMFYCKDEIFGKYVRSCEQAALY